MLRLSAILTMLLLGKPEQFTSSKLHSLAINRQLTTALFESAEEGNILSRKNVSHASFILGT